MRFAKSSRDRHASAGFGILVSAENITPLIPDARESPITRIFRARHPFSSAIAKLGVSGKKLRIASVIGIWGRYPPPLNFIRRFTPMHLGKRPGSLSYNAIRNFSVPLRNVSVPRGNRFRGRADTGGRRAHSGTSPSMGFPLVASYAKTSSGY